MLSNQIKKILLFLLKTKYTHSSAQHNDSFCNVITKNYIALIDSYVDILMLEIFVLLNNLEEMCFLSSFGVH